MQDLKPDSIALDDYRIELTDSDDPGIRSAMLEPLRRFNRGRAGESNSRPLSIVTRDAHGHIVGGLHGTTSWGWFFTQLLVLPEALRGKGLGRQLMLRAEAEAMKRGCRSAWLDTFEFQERRGFYESLGYRCVASLADYPLGFSRFIMEKSLTTAPTPLREG